jgi:DNA repair exonuclease SbcCD ATPase subunit
MVELRKITVKRARGARLQDTIDSCKDAIMSEQHNLLARIGGWFRKTQRDENGNVTVLGHPSDGASEPRSTFLRPWARQEQMINRLQESFDTLTGLMSGINDNLQKQSIRQDDLLNYLSHLPQVLETLPESNRVQGETLKAIHQQLSHQTNQQDKLTNILERMSQSGGQQTELIEELRDRVDSFREVDQTIAENLTSVGSALQAVTTTSQTSAEVLQQMRDNVDSRNAQLERILQRQSTRFTTLLAIAIFLSIAALAAVCILGYRLLNHPM